MRISEQPFGNWWTRSFICENLFLLVIAAFTVVAMSQEIYTIVLGASVRQCQ